MSLTTRTMWRCRTSERKSFSGCWARGKNAGLSGRSNKQQIPRAERPGINTWKRSAFHTFATGAQPGTLRASKKSECCYSSKGKRRWRPFESDGERLPGNDPSRAKMITFFTTAKPFTGHNGVTQRNALKSWTLVHPDAEVILFGDDEGAAGAARELGIRHEPHTEKNE